jgi:hypothetical protein
MLITRNSNWTTAPKMKLVIISLVVLVCLIKDTSAIMCYHCNSEYDPRCGDPFDPYSLGQVNCSVQPKPEHITEEPTLCRKMSQKVYGEVRVVRGCGYVPDARDNKDCLRRSGTHDVLAMYCACTSDLCNGATSQHKSQLLVGAAALLSLAFVIHNQLVARRL